MKKLTICALSLAVACSMLGCNDSEDFTCKDCADICPSEGCTDVTDPDPTLNVDTHPIDLSTRSMALVKAASCDDLRSHLLDALAMRVADQRFNTPAYCWGPWDYAVDDAADYKEESSAMPPVAANDAGSSAGEFTTTNVQEAGVDELDTVKNDGEYMYAIRGNEIHISKIWPASDMKEVATIERDHIDSDSNSYSWLEPHGLFLTDDHKLIDISTKETWSYSGYYWYGNYSGIVSVRVFDVSDPSHPKLVKTHQVNGIFEDARFIDNRLHLVTSAEPTYSWYDIDQLAKDDIPGVPKFHNPCDDVDYDERDKWSPEAWEAYEKAEEAWLAKGEENTKAYLPVIRAWLDKQYPELTDFKWPTYNDGKTSRPALDCKDLYIPAMASDKDGFLMVSEISGKDFGDFNSVAVADSGWTVYASQKNLYVSSFSYDWYWTCDNNCGNYTHIHHFDLGDKAGSVAYVNSGEINGIADNPFFYSEYDNHLRVVSSPDTWNSPTGHKLSIFDIKSPVVMKETGSIEGFGKDESIYAARMVGDRGYVVTFRNTDPLFVFDLSNHTKPILAGELKINGYSSYIHPVGKDHLLTIGMNGDDFGLVGGMKLDLYDVSNPAAPKRVAQTVIDDAYDEPGEGRYSSSYSWSDAISNHHAFQYHEGSGLLAIPVNIDKWSCSYSGYDYSYEYFSGMFVYRIKTGSDFKFVGGVDHSDLVSDDYSWWTDVNRSRFYFKNAGVYDQDAVIYTMSRHGIKANDANNPDTQLGVIKYATPISRDHVWYD